MSGERSWEVKKLNAPTKKEIRTVRILICCGICSALLFFNWFVWHVESGNTPLFWLLTVALLFKLAKMGNEWYYYWSPSVPKAPTPTRKWAVDILTTSCPGEPRDMIIRTLRAMRDVRYPHTNYLCDEGDDPELKKVCEELGVIHVTRKEKTNAKAGNINNALRGASGEICLVLDPDHVPRPEFLDRVLPYFEDEKIGYVQCVQSYGNQEESFIARGAAEQTYHFYGPMMMTMNSYGTVQAIGANCTFRRKALDSIGGHAAGLAEDMHTAMQLQAKGWKAVYVPEVLARGLVPATISSFYKQQLKWSRGVFELLFRVFPKLCGNFSWRQRIHYFCIPWYFLFGLINLIDFIIPLYALAIARVPWEVDLGQFAVFFIPMCVSSLVVRLYVQRWLLEKHERGLHLTGGMLRMATWWIYLVGFIYAVFNIKVPYIPTPKEDAHQNHFRLCIPNLLVILFCALFVVYGLSIDWSPYSWAMASYSVIVMGMLAYTTFVSQQKFLDNLKASLTRTPGISHIFDRLEKFAYQVKHRAYGMLQQGALVVTLAVSLVFFGYTNLDKENKELLADVKEDGGFYWGYKKMTGDTVITASGASIILFEKYFGDTVQPLLPESNKGSMMPFLQWQFGKQDAGKLLGHRFDPFLQRCVQTFRGYRSALFISLEGDITPMAWQYIYGYFSRNGISNITWVWNADRASHVLFPGDEYVDWISIPYTPGTKGSFPEQYAGLRKHLLKFSKPVMLTNFNGMDENGATYLSEIKIKYKEIRSILFASGKIGKDLAQVLNSETYFRKPYCANKLIDGPPKAYVSPFIKKQAGTFQLLINKEPYYMKGMAYNTAHDWRDGFMPLTRRQLEYDLQLIKEMGANTIRRYDKGIYDRNILNIAPEYGLNVLYGFWFDPKVDYYKDSARVEKYIREVLERVEEIKDKPSIIAWSLGNETWGQLKHHFSRPHLIRVRGEYIKLLEHLAQRIHEIDPSRPVFTCIEHEENQLTSELVSIRDGVPSCDAVGINSYYKEQVSQVNSVFRKFDSLRPYFISEFGPKGYWKTNYNHVVNGMLVEETEIEKAQWYKYQWKNYIQKNKGANIGGFAYCWHDRMEGSCTWFGLTDMKGRMKPAYFALKEAWTGKKTRQPVEPIRILMQTSGNEYVFSAAGKNIPGLQYEWYLYRDNFTEATEDLRKLNSKKMISVKIPGDTLVHRVYLYASDDKGHVYSASLPFKGKTTNAYK